MSYFSECFQMHQFIYILIYNFTKLGIPKMPAKIIYPFVICVLHYSIDVAICCNASLYNHNFDNQNDE
jgi:hypothetical protein